MKKVKKMADGGISGLGDMLGKPGGGDNPASAIPSGGGGGGSAMDGLGAVNQGASAIGSALGRASEAIGGGGGGGGMTPGYEAKPYKRGGKVTTTRRISTGQQSKKSSNW